MRRSLILFRVNGMCHWRQSRERRRQPTAPLIRVPACTVPEEPAWETRKVVALVVSACASRVERRGNCLTFQGHESIWASFDATSNSPLTLARTFVVRTSQCRISGTTLTIVMRKVRMMRSMVSMVRGRLACRCRHLSCIASWRGGMWMRPSARCPDRGKDRPCIAGFRRV